MLTLLIFGGVALTMIADVLLKRSDAHNPGLIFFGIVLYAAVGIPVVFAFRMTDFGNLFLLWEAATVIAGIAVATLVFKESLTLQRVIAFLLVMTGMVLSYGH